MKNNGMSKILKFIHFSENLKKELRHSWLSDNRQESVAEHTWRMALMAMLLVPKAKNPLNLGKLLRIIIVHDLVEAEAGDVPVFVHLTNKKTGEEKEKNEKLAMKKITSMLDKESGNEIRSLWQEYEDQKSREAKFAKTLDKLEAMIQHTEASLETWEKPDYEFPKKWRHITEKLCRTDPILEEIYSLAKIEEGKKLNGGKQFFPKKL